MRFLGDVLIDDLIKDDWPKALRRLRPLEADEQR
jgi:hypothetical protein